MGLKDERVTKHKQKERERNLQAEVRRLRDAGKDASEVRARLNIVRANLSRTLAHIERLLRLKKPDFNGHPSNVTRPVQQAIVRGNKAGLLVTSTTDGTHSPGSLHYTGRAADFGGYVQQDKINFQNSEWARGGQTELIGPTNGQTILGGSRTTLSEGTALEQAHDNHVHVGYA